MTDTCPQCRATEFHSRLNRDCLTEVYKRLQCSGNHGDILATLGVLIDDCNRYKAALQAIRSGLESDNEDYQVIDAIDEALQND